MMRRGQLPFLPESANRLPVLPAIVVAVFAAVRSSTQRRRRKGEGLPFLPRIANRAKAVADSAAIQVCAYSGGGCRFCRDCTCGVLLR